MKKINVILLLICFVIFGCSDGSGGNIPLIALGGNSGSGSKEQDDKEKEKTDCTAEFYEYYKQFEEPVLKSSGEKAARNNVSVGDIIVFGMYPYTVLPEDSEVIVDESKYVNAGQLTYYKGSDNKWYCKIYVRKPIPGKNEYKYEYRYFLVQEIFWKVITDDYQDNGDILIMPVSKADLDKFIVLAVNKDDMHFIDYPDDIGEYDKEPVRIIDGKTVYVNDYSASKTRAYFNGLSFFNFNDDKEVYESFEYKNKGLLQTAFVTDSSQNYIKTTRIDYNRYGEMDKTNKIIAAKFYINDKIFLLSYDDLYKYGFYNKRARSLVNETDCLECWGVGLMYSRSNEAYSASRICTSENFAGDVIITQKRNVNVSSHIAAMCLSL